MDRSDTASTPDPSADSSRVESTVAWWHRAERGWKAICLSAVLLAAVELGVQIPW